MARAPVKGRPVTEYLNHAATFVASLVVYIAVALLALRMAHLPSVVKLVLFWSGFLFVCWWFGTQSKRANRSGAA
jgi:hypothetical protein